MGNYTSPDGMSISLKRITWIRITWMVQGVRLEWDTQLSKKALERSPGELWKEQEIRFHIEDRSGNHIVNVSSADPNSNVLTSQHIAGETTGEMHWSYTFSDLPVDQPYYLVLDGYLVKERDGHALTFDPAHVNYPLSFDSMGDQLKLGRYEVNHEGDDLSKSLEGSLPVIGKVKNGMDSYEYKAIDEYGNTYKVDGRGSYRLTSDKNSAGIELDQFKSKDDDMSYELRIFGLDRVPEKLTLIRTTTKRWYGNTNWKIKIQETKNTINKKEKQEKYKLEIDRQTTE
ncbi:hypothetical protein [Paenibacillus sp. Z6-24]